MQYREVKKSGDQLSILGYGCMRFPQKNGKIDEERTERQIRQAIEKGVNYFDTAWIYPGSEVVLGRILAKGLRSQVKIATKLPPYMCRSTKDMYNIFEKQLGRLQTDYIDYYLMHALNNFAAWERLKSLGVLAFITEKKENGQIKQIGFSYHGDKEDFKKIIDDYDWDFCQIQYNYLDVNFQAGVEGLQFAYEKDVSVIVMEPLRGGSLVGKMPDEVKRLWGSAALKRSNVDWALRWLWNQKEVCCVLSGMNEEDHIDENIRIANETQINHLTVDEMNLYDQVKEAYLGLMKVGCTGCGYCMPCPYGVDIPTNFSFYNSKYLFDEKYPRMRYMGMLGGMSGGKSAYASQCTQCGKCEKHCPQNIPIRAKLKDVKNEMEIPALKPVFKLIKRLIK